MKKFLLGTVALLALGATANAADLPARAYTKAPPMAPVYSWTGFYLAGGGGYGMWNADTNSQTDPGGIVTSNSQRFGGRGYFGVVGGGFDYQFAPAWVAGVFADAQFGDIKGSISDPATVSFGSLKNETNWAVGGRLGYLVTPTVLSYVNAGYSNAEFSGGSYVSGGGALNGLGHRSFNRDGWFVGGGVEHSLNIFGFSAPGLFMKTEYRFAEYDRGIVPTIILPGGGPTGSAVSTKPYIQTVSTQLVYRFNYGR